MQYQVGCDPELFLRDKKGRLASAHDVVPGTKAAPFPVDKGFVQHDGTSAEFNIFPALSEEDFLSNITTVLKQLQDLVSLNKPGFELFVQPTVQFPTKYFKDLPPDAKEFGCTPDYDAWSQQMNVFKGTKKPIRTGAGHIHVGWREDAQIDETHIYDCIQATKQYDSFLYFGSLIYDHDDLRRTLYGKIGAYRPKGYGVEYRPLSNAYLADPDLIRWVYRSVVRLQHVLDEFDCKIFDDSKVETMIARARKGEKFSENELVDYHVYCVDRFNLPCMPEGYLGDK